METSSLFNNAASRVFIGLGANLNQPEVQLTTALEAFQQIPDTQLIKCSPFYRTKPMGPQDQNDYINAVAELATLLNPECLLDHLQRIENEHGRVRNGERWGPRTLDLDILLFDQLELNSARLTVPHYGIKQRNFVIIPLMDIAPSLVFPDGESVSQVANQLGRNGISQL